MFRIFWQVSIGQIGKKDVKNAKKKKTVNDGIYEEFWISNVYIFFRKIFHGFLKFFDKISNP